MKQSGQKFKLCMRLILCIITNYGKILCIFTRPSTYILDVAISEAVSGSLLHFFSGRLATRVSTRRCRSLVLMLRISLNWPYVLKSGYVCVMECSIDIVHYVGIPNNIQHSKIRRFQAVYYCGLFCFRFV